MRWICLLVLVGCVSKERVTRSQARTELGRAMLMERNAPQAITTLEEATRLDPNNWDAWNKLGLAYHAQGADDLAEKAFRRGIRANSREAEIRNNYGYFLTMTGRADEAIAQFEVALKDLDHRRPAVVLANLGQALVELGRTEEGIARLDEAVTRAPNLCPARFARGLAYERSGQPARAIEDFETVIRLCGDEATGAYFNAGRLLLDLNDAPAACAYLRTAAAGDREASPLIADAARLFAERCRT